MMLTGTSPTEQPKWTDERVAQFKDLYAQGLSHGQIGAFFGVSRNASIGKAHRLGLQGRTPARQPKPWIAAGISESAWHRRRAKASHRASQRRDGASADKPIYRRVRSAPANSFAPASIGSYATDLKPEAIADPVTLMELQAHHCRWPVDRSGEPMMYCGGDSVLGFSYCAGHCRMAYTSRPSYYLRKQEYFSDRRVSKTGRRAA